jgi:hypothetical protein
MNWFTLSLLALGALLLVTRYQPKADSSRWRAALVAGWAVLVLGTSLAMYLAESAWTASHLAGGYVCCAESQLPAAGSTARAFRDFWTGAIGRQLLPIALLGGSLASVLIHLRRGRDLATTLMRLFRINLAFLVLSLALSLLGWAISDWINGPAVPPFHGLDRTWPGIVLHALLWIVYFRALATMFRPSRPTRFMRRATMTQSLS